MKIFIVIKQVFGSIFFKLIISALLLWLVFRNVSLVEVYTQLKAISPLVLILYVVANMVIFYVLAVRWQMLAFGKYDKVAAWHFFMATLIGNFYGLFLPSTIGGDLVKWAHLSHLELSKKKLFFSVFLDRVIGMIGMLMLGAAAIFIAQYSFGVILPPIFTFISIGFLAGVTSFILLILFPVGFNLLSKVPLLGKKLPIDLIFQLQDYFLRQKKLLLGLLPLALLTHIAVFSLTGVVGQAVGFNISLIYFLVFIPLISLVLLLPVSFSGFGAGELAYIYFFALAGVRSETVLVLTSLMVVTRIMLALLGWLTGVIYSLTVKKRQAVSHAEA